MTDTLKIAPDLYSNPGRSPIPGMRGDYREVEVEEADMVITQLIAIGILPAGCRLLDAFIDADDLDDGATITLNLGILNTYYNKKEASVANPAAYSSGGKTDTNTDPGIVSGHEIISASTIAQAGGRVKATLPITKEIGVDFDNDRIIALQLGVAPTTPKAGTIGVGILFDAA